jgi:hypothetical protein
MKNYFWLFPVAALFAFVYVPAQGSPGHHASGGGTYTLSGIRTEFQLSESHVQCKIANGAFPDGTLIQMFMESNTINAVTIDSVAKTVVISGTMVSTTRLRFTDGTSTTLSETVPFVAFAQDKATPGAGSDTFSITVNYTNTPSFDQFDLFGSPATFAGTIDTGDVQVR